MKEAIKVLTETMKVLTEQEMMKVKEMMTVQTEIILSLKKMTVKEKAVEKALLLQLETEVAWMVA